MQSLAPGHARALLRRSGLVAVAGAATALLAGCGTGTPAAAPTKTVTATAGTASTPSPAATTPAATSPAAPAGPGPCSAADLRASLGAGSGAAGTLYRLIVLTNTSDSACTLYGYPGVSFVTGPGGSVIGAPATRNALIKDTLVTLQPGGAASALVGVVDTGVLPPASCKPGQATLLRIYPPGDLGAVYVTFDSGVCTKAGAKYMTVSAVHAGISSSF